MDGDENWAEEALVFGAEDAEQDALDQEEAEILEEDGEEEEDAE